VTDDRFYLLGRHQPSVIMLKNIRFWRLYHFSVLFELQQNLNFKTQFCYRTNSYPTNRTSCEKLTRSWFSNQYVIFWWSQIETLTGKKAIFIYFSSRSVRIHKMFEMRYYTEYRLFATVIVFIEHRKPRFVWKFYFKLSFVISKLYWNFV